VQSGDHLGGDRFRDPGSPDHTTRVATEQAHKGLVIA